MRTTIATAVIVMAGLVVGLLPGMAGAARTDPVDENFVLAYFFWEDGHGRISWDRPHASDDNVDAGNNSVGGENWFVAEPLQRTIYMNVSRMVQLDLFFQGSTAISVDAEITAGPAFFTGGLDVYNSVSYCSGAADPGKSHCAPASGKPSAPGYTVASHRMQAELDTLEKGQVLRVRILHRDAAVASYGLTGDHASVLRLPVFSPDEALYRVPKYAKPDGGSSSGTLLPPVDPVRDLVERLLGAGGIAFGGLFLATRARGRRLVVVLLMIALAAGAMGGCVGKPHSGPPGGAPTAGPGLGGSANTYIVSDPENETGLSNATAGSIYGVVSDLDNLPVNGAYVLLVGTTRSSRTDPYGRFNFQGLAPGPYGIRIDRDGFKPFEATVRVEPASITKLEVVLEFLVVKETSQRPHRHDYWFDEQGRTSDAVELYNGPMPGAGAAAYFELPAPIIVKPGTIDVVIVAEWDSGGTRMLRTKTPNDPFNSTALYPRASGVPFHLRTTWEMTDPGHAAYTYWDGFSLQGLFGITQHSAECSGPAGYSDPRCPPSNYRLRLMIHKGVVPLEPPHRDDWSGAEAVAVVENITKGLTSSCMVACPLGGSSDSSSTFGPVGGQYAGATRKAFNASWQPAAFVPFETRWLEVKVGVDRSQYPQDSSDAPWNLFYHDARTTERSACRPDPAGAGNTRVVSQAPLYEKDPTSRGWTWRFPIESQQADPPYARYPVWCFFIAPSDENAQLADDYHALATGAKPPVFVLSVRAHRDAIPT